MMAVPRPFTPDLPPGYAIRDAGGSDAPAIARVYEATYPDDTGYPLVEAPAVRSAVFDDGSVTPFVVETGGRIVGVAAIEFDSFDEGNAQICKLAVHPDHQGRGLGRELLKHRLDVLHADPAFDGLVYSAAVTSHPASQHNRSPVASNRTAFINTVRTLDVDRLVREEIEDV